MRLLRGGTLVIRDENDWRAFNNRDINERGEAARAKPLPWEICSNITKVKFRDVPGPPVHNPLTRSATSLCR